MDLIQTTFKEEFPDVEFRIQKFKEKLRKKQVMKLKEKLKIKQRMALKRQQYINPISTEQMKQKSRGSFNTNFYTNILPYYDYCDK